MIRLMLTAVGLVFTFLIFTVVTLPDVKVLNGCMETSMFKVKLCPDNGHYVRLGNISKSMIDTVLASEDSAFYTHSGFDWFELKKSMSENLKTGKIHRGGSTITQQLAKNVFLYKEKSYWRKIKEAYLAYSLEKNFSKDIILEKYLNVVEFGPKLFGVKDAAQFYFQKNPSQLNPLESAFLAFLLPNPKVYSKSFRDGKLSPYAQKMMRVLLARLKSFKKISDDTYQYAIAQVDLFPWTSLASVDFEEPPLVDVAESDFTDGDEVIDEETLELLLKEELSGESPPDDILE